MSSLVRPKDAPQIQPRNPLARPGPIPNIRLEALYTERAPYLVVREDSSSTSDSATSSASCGPHDSSGACKKSSDSGGSNNTLPIVLGVIIPLGIALLVLIFLHRRHVRKLRREDADDKHKSLDFGLGDTHQGAGKKNRRKGPEMTMSETKGVSRRGQGLSLDLGMHNPYLLPPELQQSRESLHSLSRSMNTGDDKYRATTFIPDDGSIRPPSSLRSPIDDSSSYTGSSSRRFQPDSKQNLLRNAQDNPVGAPLSRMSTNSVQSASAISLPAGTRTIAQANNNNLLTPATAEPIRDSYVSTASSNGAVNALRASNNYLGRFISGGNKAESPKKEPTTTVTEITVEPPSEDIRAPPPAIVKDAPVAPPTILLPQNNSAPTISLDGPDSRQPRLPQLSFIDSQGNKQSSVELEKPLEIVPDSPKGAPQHFEAPSTDLSPLTQATQSRSNHPDEQTSVDEVDYYDEYEDYGSQDHQHDGLEEYQHYQDYVDYDPRRLTMGVRPLPPDDPSENPEQRANRIRSFYKEYFDDTKPQSSFQNGQYYDGAEDYYDTYGSGGHYDQSGVYPPHRQPQNGVHGRHRATVSNGSYISGPRAFSSASGRYGGRPPHLTPKRKLPPPTPLNLLPTPHLLKEDTVLPIDFAPPQRFQAQRAGTPDSLRGGLRPFSPAARPHVPLVSSFDDLAVLPSPHALRKSSTFTALDFAPPRGPMGVDTMSETGSIRSNRSGVSAMHLHNIRKGAYRVSRIPKEVAGTKDELATALKPQWNLNR
ncbi:hypothetical protein A1O3_09617 [Capronia epimyces CBS 606.96]|uniref:Uncharacterized protein n=1 Tax=Capronia epimyces CBS 606.96 TaxID=1182542 RepID=W9XKC4_9EURO|nr:uncharacterized protein A1O3_09617 [Capronia epimyces CBS 606.96]EXJ77391.1 hypothetical protein A1O3_09617 [Capronia epimyces CBS 606.96]